MPFATKTYPRVVAFGEALIDRVVDPDASVTHVVGGSPLNVLVALARQGYDTAIVTPISIDDFGDMIRNHLVESRVDLSLAIHTHKPTTLADTRIIDGEPDYEFLIDGHSQGVWLKDHIHDKAVGNDLVVISGSFALSREPMASVFDDLVTQDDAEDRTLIFDPNIRPSVIGDDPHDIQAAKDRFDKWARSATIVKASKVDILWRYPNLSIDKAAALLIHQGVKMVTITDGENGAYAFTKKGSAFRPGVALTEQELEEGNTIGAGDTYNAGTIIWLLENEKTSKTAIESLTSDELGALIDSGQALATEVCKLVGADPPWKAGLNPVRTTGAPLEW